MTHIKTASRLEGISEYYFAAKLREIAEMRAAGKNVINLGIGSPDLPPDPSVLEILHTSAQMPTSHGYQSYTGTPALREAWAKWYGTFYQAKLDPATEILPLIGSKEGIMHIAMTFLEAGDIALVPNPGYPTYRAASMLAGATVQYYDLSAEMEWQPDLVALEAQDLSKVKIMWVNYPHMPTGAPAKSEVFRSLITFGKKHNILIVNDNPYSFILNSNPQSILSQPGAMEVALELNSLSKSNNMAGWRIGAVLGNPAHLTAILRFKSNMDSGQFLPLQHAAIQALNLSKDWYTQLNTTYTERQVQAFAILQAVDCQFDSNQQGMFVWAKIPDHWADCYALSDHLLYQANVFLTPGGIFGSAGERYVRISLCQDIALFKTALERIKTL
jgi:aspartate/methionine/tyrosine aminotransferase